MDILINIVNNPIVSGLITGLIGFVLGWVWKKIKDTMSSQSARRFWKSLTNGKARIVVPHFSGHVKFQHEQIGVIAGGTANGLMELSSYLRLIGIAQIPLLNADHLKGDGLKTHLIFLGGPRSHPLLKETITRLTTTWRFEKKSTGENIIVDEKNGKTIEAVIRDDAFSSGQQEVGMDYAVIFSTKNPFAPERRLLYIAGIHDYGTWAGIRFVMTDEFIKHPLILNKKDVETLIEVDVLRQYPQKIKLIEMRELAT